MIASISSLSGLVYIQLGQKRNICKTLDFDAQTIVEVDARGELVAIEMIKPSQSILNRIAKKFQRADLARINLDSLQKAIN